MKALFAAAALTIMCPNIVAAQFESALEYKTREFSEDGSPIPSLFMCMHAGQKAGLMPNARSLANELLINQGVTKNQLQLWENDAELLVRFEVDGLNVKEYWQVSCARKFGLLAILYRG